MFKKILIANRGEISHRIKKTTDRLGIESVFFESDNPNNFLDIEKVLNFAKEKRVDAIHPGYGFLSENENFAKRVEKEGFIFIGPNSEFLEIFGNKRKTKDIAFKNGFEIIPEAKEGVFPAMLKMVDGAGGRGTRIIEKPSDIEKINGEYYLEKIIKNARQIELQIISNNDEQEIIGIRDGSIQLRNQKMIEFSVEPHFLGEKLENFLSKIKKMFKGYSGLATIEFLFDVDLQKLFFMEVNPRIQVEHTVTEESTTLDLVELQLKISANEKFEMPKSSFKHFSIEARVLAIDPETFIPNPGIISSVLLPEKIRIDNGFLFDNQKISPFFDPLLAKFIAKGESFDEARVNLLSAINKTKINGIKTNLNLIKKILENENFEQNKINTYFLNQVI